MLKILVQTFLQKHKTYKMFIYFTAIFLAVTTVLALYSLNVSDDDCIIFSYPWTQYPSGISRFHDSQNTITTYTSDRNFAQVSRYMTNRAVILYVATQFLLFLRNHFSYLVPILLQAWYPLIYASNECKSKLLSTISRCAAP